MPKDRKATSSGIRAISICLVGALLLCLPVAMSLSGEALAERLSDYSGSKPSDDIDDAGTSGKGGGFGEASADVSSLAEDGSLAVDGNALTQQQASMLVDQRIQSTPKVARYNQEKVLPSGCEILSLSAAMSMRGHNVSPVDLANNYVQMGDNLATDYLGSPYEDGGCLAPCIVDAANGWLEANEATDRAYNLTGSSFDGVSKLVKLGYPVLIWTTEELAEPVFLPEEVEGLRWYMPEHCVVLYKVDDDEVKVSDSITGLKSYERTQFATVYEQCGNMGMTILPPLE